MLKLDNISQIYATGNESVLKNVSLEVKAGDYIALEGVSGSGKSTLLYIMAGLLRPTEGKVYWNDKDIYQMSDNELTSWRGKNIGYLFQNIQMSGALTVRENMKFVREFGNDKNVNIEEMLEIFGLTEVADSLPGTLSGGQKRRAMIASVLIRKPQIVLADEPTNDLDHEWAGKVIEYLKKVVQPDGALVLVTHDLKWAEKAEIKYKMEEGSIYRQDEELLI